MTRLLSDKAMADARIDVDPRRQALDLLYDAASSAPIVVALFSSLVGGANLLTRFGTMLDACATISGYLEFLAYSLLVSYSAMLAGTAVMGWIRMKRHEGRNPLHDAALLVSKLVACFASLYSLRRFLGTFGARIFVHSNGFPTTVAAYVEVYAASFLMLCAAVLIGLGVVDWLHAKVHSYTNSAG